MVHGTRGMTDQQNDDHPEDRDDAQNRPVMQPDGEHEGEAPTGEKGAQDIAQGADPDS